MKLPVVAVVAGLAISVSACQEQAPRSEADVAYQAPPPMVSAPRSPEPGSKALEPARLPLGVSPRPAWLGTRALPVDAQGLGIATRTPKVLRDRRLATIDLLPPPPRGFSFSSGPIPAGVLRRSTWHKGCPVPTSELTYLRMSFWGFDERRHTGEMIVHDEVASDVITVFRKLYRVRWPIEEMRVTARRELDLPPTGDGNNTTAFVCRNARLSSEWSEHASGRAIDINPFHNPYVNDAVTIPELAIAYRARGWDRPGMIRHDSVVTKAFAAIGWGWGGEWWSAKDWMHFSLSGG